MKTRRKFKNWDEAESIIDGLLKAGYTFDKKHIMEELKLGKEVAVKTDMLAVTTLTIKEVI